MNGKKAQTAIELLTVYGWVVLLILVLFIVAYYSGYLNFTNMLPQYCSITPTLACNTYKFGFMPDGKTMVLVYRIVNGLGYDIYLPSNSLALTVENIGKLGKNVYNGTCYPSLVPVKPGNPISCIVMINDTDMVPQIGKNLDFRMVMRYRNCEASEQYKVDKNCSSAPEYTVGGTIRTQMEPKGAGLFACGDNVCDYKLGENPNNCCDDCKVAYLDLSADPSSVGTGVDTILTATATYADGTPAGNATITFDKPDFDPSSDDFNGLSTRPYVTNTSNDLGVATCNFSSILEGAKLINASTCGADASITVTVSQAPPNGLIVFSRSPAYIPAGFCYDLNVTVYNLTGSPQVGDRVCITPDRYSEVKPDRQSLTPEDCLSDPSTFTTDSTGTIYVVLCSDTVHVGRLKARSSTLGISNWTNAVFGPPPGRLMLWIEGGNGMVGSEGSVDISGCLYDTNGQNISDVTINLTTDFGYFSTDDGEQKIPGLQPFQTSRPTYLVNARNNEVRYEKFSNEGEVADPLEMDVFAGRFVKVMMSSSPSVNSSDRAKAIASYLNVTKTNGRTVYVFYNLAYNRSIGSYGGKVSWVYQENLYTNLTSRLSSVGIPRDTDITCTSPTKSDCFTVISDPYQLRDIMLNNASKAILILASEYFPVEVWNHETDGGVPKKFFQRGGIQIHTGDWEYYYALNSSGGDSNRLKPFYDDASKDILNWPYDKSALSCDNCWTMTPVRMNKTVFVTTYVGGCFNFSTSNSVLYSNKVGIANITATYYSISNSTIAYFNSIPCGNTPHGQCDLSNPPKFCISGYLADNCTACDPSCTGVGSGTICDPGSGQCLPPAGSVVLTLRSFNGSGTWLPNDNYSAIQVVAQVKDTNGNLLEDVPVTWGVEDNYLQIVSILCDKTTKVGCGDDSALPPVDPPKAAILVKSNPDSPYDNTVLYKKVTARAMMYGQTLTSNITITINGTNVGSVRWRQVSPTLLPADNYTDSTICLSTFNTNDSALGNVSACFNTTLGTFGNGLTRHCLATNQVGQACAYLKSDTSGNANVSVNITDHSGTSFTAYFYWNIRFYMPTSLIITSVPTLTPCAQCSTSSSRITATVRDASNNPIAGVPYVYFWIKKDSNSWPAALVWYYDSYFNTWWYGGQFGLLKPGWISGGWSCSRVGYTNGTCSNSTIIDGSVSTKFGPIYPPGQYNINASTWYNCDAEPFSPDNCHKSVSNVTLINVSPVPKTFIISPVTRSIKPNGVDSVPVNTTLYGSDGSLLPKVWCYASWNNVYDWTSNTYIVPSPSNSNAYGITNSSAQCSIQSTSDVPGNFTLQFESAYFNITNWVYVNNYTTLTFGPMVGSITIDKSTDFAYADGRLCPNITITVSDTTGQRMNNLTLNINPLQVGSHVGQIDCPPGNLRSDGSCYGVHTDSNGQFTTKVCSSYEGTAVFSVYVPYSNATDVLSFSNSTTIGFAQPPLYAYMSKNTSILFDDGVDRAVFRTQFRNSTAPTPGVPVTCNVSDNGVFYPFSNLVTDLNGNVSVNVSANSTPVTLSCWYTPAYGIVPEAEIQMNVNTSTQAGNFAINVSAYPSELMANSLSRVVATVMNKSDNKPARDGFRVNFSTSWGGVLSGAFNTTTNGNATIYAKMTTNGSIFVKANIGGDFDLARIQYD